MCEPTRRFLLCTCVPGTPPQRGRVAFRLARHVETIETEMLGLLATPVDALPEGLDGRDVEAQLAAGGCFDFPYEPEEGDRLTLWSVGSRQLFLSYQVRGGRFRAALPAGFGEVMAPLSEGLLAYLDRRPRNALRAVLVAALDGPDPALRGAAAELARLLDAISDAELTDEAHPLLEYAFEVAGPREASAATARAYEQLVDAARAAARCTDATPSIPARSPLPPDEAARLLARLAARVAADGRAGSGPGSRARGGAAVEAFRAHLGPAETTLVRVRPDEGYAERLSSAWLADPLARDGSVWADPELRWVLRAGRDGIELLEARPSP